MVYLVEDDDNIRELVIYTLNHSGIEAKGFSRPTAFYEENAKALPKMVILDIMLPEEDGLTILRKLRANKETKKLPVMMLSAKASEYDKVTGLDAGADDYVSKPFGMMELVARVRALLRRSADDEAPNEYTVGRLTVIPDAHRVIVDGEQVQLTRKEYDILVLLIKSGELVVTRERLLSEVWGYAFEGESRTVDVHIRTLRQKLGAAGGYVETIRGVGYCIRLNEEGI
ncbi:MAG: response regulator transcription factor [Lachnospiraceae bacterium]|nr:response regulator transcription factor [Lachnospiraceae bacterium]